MEFSIHIFCILQNGNEDKVKGWTNRYGLGGMS
jgi:hypothetical protein